MAEKKVSTIEGGELIEFNEKLGSAIVRPASGMSILLSKADVDKKKIALQDAGYNVLETSKVDPKDSKRLFYSFLAIIKLENGYEKQIEFGAYIPC